MPQDAPDRAAAEPRSSAFLLYRDDAGRQRLLELTGDRATLGRRGSSDVPLAWDSQVSRLHAELVRLGDDWVACDEGLSHNGTFVNGERLRGRRRLRDGDTIAVGETVIAFCAAGASTVPPTRAAGERTPAVALTPAQRRVLAALGRPLREPGYAAPASNPAIAGELVLSVETVKGTLSRLYELYGLAELPQSQKRAALAARAVELVA